MTSHHLCSDDPQFSVCLTDDQVVKLCLSGKIERCDGKHENQADDEIIYHPAEGYRIDSQLVEQMIRRQW